MSTPSTPRIKKQIKQLLFIFVPIVSFNVLARANIESPTKMELPKVSFEIVQKTKDKKILSYPARVEPVVGSTLLSEIDGTVKDIKLSLGSKVKKGQTILIVQNSDPAFTYAPISVRAPFSGVITQIFASQLTKVAKGDKLATVVQPNKLKMTVEIPSSEISFINPTQDGIFTTDDKSEANGSEFFVNAVSPVVDTKTNTAQAELLFLSKKNLPKIGTVGYVKFQIPMAENIKIPESSVSYFEGEPIVRLLDQNGKIKKQKIQLESQDGNEFIVKNGLSGGEKLVVRAGRPLKEGESVEAEAAKKE